MDLIHKIYFLTLKHHHCCNIAAYVSRFLVSGLLFSVSIMTCYLVQKYSEEQPATISAFQLMKRIFTECSLISKERQSACRVENALKEKQEL